MPKHPEITIKITQPIDNTRLVLQCLDVFWKHGIQNEAEVFINDIAQMGLVPAVQAWFNVEIEAQK
ncbi:MAG: hypothetical protein R8M70_02980 [Alphaproteobacteria bacterium]|nr:hypothetical protein [Alphaproteobacteria bacterium]